MNGQQMVKCSLESEWCSTVNIIAYAIKKKGLKQAVNLYFVTSIEHIFKIYYVCFIRIYFNILYYTKALAVKKKFTWVLMACPQEHGTKGAPRHSSALMITSVLAGSFRFKSWKWRKKMTRIFSWYTDSAGYNYLERRNGISTFNWD